ncbi:MAG: nucleotide pyrophosphatase, partial [Candidatus Omnitrophica bacterium]|nr:nucleotide pyrophosphatase [Candidatus Omnitrophota bacterium]
MRRELRVYEPGDRAKGLLTMERAQRKVCVIGLDCASPQLIFHQFKDRLPAFRKIMEQGEYAPMRSIHPPITIPAWMSMCSGQDAGQMGIYGFRSRTGNSYIDFDISSSRAFRHVPKLWDKLRQHGKKSILVGIPPSYPVYPVEGWLISGFLCPDSSREFTYPKELKEEIRRLIGEYRFDVSFRTHDRDRIIESVWEMTEKRFDVIEYLLTRKPWDFCMSVEIGLDRVHHAF